MSESSLANLITYNPATIGANDLLSDALGRFEAEHLQFLPVIEGQNLANGQRHVVGMLSLAATRRELLKGDKRYVRDAIEADADSGSRTRGINGQAGVAEPLRVMRTTGSRSLPVVENNKLLGVISIADYLQEFAYGNDASLSDLVGEHMLKPAPQVDADDPPQDVLEFLLRDDLAAAAVTAGDCPLGIISRLELGNEPDIAGTLGQLLTPDVTTIGKAESIGDVIWHFIEFQVPALPVVDHGNRLIGLLPEDAMLDMIAVQLSEDAHV